MAIREVLTQKKGRFVPPNAHFKRIESLALKYPPLILSTEQRLVVEKGLQELCLKRHWQLHAINVRSNHIHFVVTATKIKPERVMSDMKAKATRELRKTKTIFDDQKPWTEHGSTIYLYTQEEFVNACRYVRDCQ